MATTFGDTAAASDGRAAPAASPPRWRTWLRHLLCVLALMWTGIVNGQPFFFDDSTNYIRAADMAVYLVSGRSVSTVWTDRYRSALPDAATGAPGRPSGEAVHRTTANDISSGLVMSGRSPYIGALMYLGWVLGWFWPFVLLQAAICYLLILMTLRRFDLDRPQIVTAVTLFLALTTSVPTYNSLLLADGFSSFGILSFALLALPGPVRRWEFWFLVAVTLMFTVSHLTHFMMLGAMAVAIGSVALLRLMPVPRRIWAVAGGSLLVGVLALQFTAVATRAAVGKEPQLLPLLTARIYIDGPGKAFIDSGCENRRFQVCRVSIVRPLNNSTWLFSNDPVEGVYMTAPVEARRRMGEEDVAFTLAVLRHYPAWQVGMSAWNTIKQLFWIKYTGLNRGCFATDPTCWESLPPSVLEHFRRTPAGRNLWPEDAMSMLLYVVVVASIGVIAVGLPRLARRDRPRFVLMRGLLILVAVAMLTCSFFGGAVAEPQYRYQGRLIWLIPLLAAVVMLRNREMAGQSRPDPEPAGTAASV